MSKQDSNNPQKAGVISRDEKRSAAISENSLLVPLTKSKKLAAIRKRSQSLQTIETNPLQSGEIPFSGLNKDANGLLKEAQAQINAKIDDIMASYPPGKKNKMFSLKYGSRESIRQMTMKAIFTRLAIVKPKKFALIENLDYFGNDAQSRKADPSR